MAGPSGWEDKGDGEKDILLSFFCNECGILLRDVTEIFDHHEITPHEGTFSSMRINMTSSVICVKNNSLCAVNQIST